MQEQFAIRTVIFTEAKTKFDKVSSARIMESEIRTVIVSGRFAASMAVEKIGKFTEQSHERMRRFLDGGIIPKSGNLTFETEQVLYAGQMQANLAMILRIDQDAR